ncbi:hypothetical protein EJ02DRAFT_484407, partial [Clathrospora elynae]
VPSTTNLPTTDLPNTISSISLCYHLLLILITDIYPEMRGFKSRLSMKLGIAKPGSQAILALRVNKLAMQLTVLNSHQKALWLFTSSHQCSDI